MLQRRTPQRESCIAAIVVVAVVGWATGDARAQEAWSAAADREVATQIEEHRNALARCQSRARAANAALRETESLALRVTVGRGGRIRLVRFDDGREARSALERCVVAVVRRFHFPPPDAMPDPSLDFLLGFDRGGAPTRVVEVVVVGPPPGDRGAPAGAAGPPPRRSGRVVPDGSTLEIEGALPRDIAMRALQSRLRLLERCYDAGLRRHPELAGRLVVELEIGANGSVAAAEVLESELGDDTMARCVVTVMRRLRLPTTAAEGAVTMRVALALSLREPSPR